MVDDFPSKVRKYINYYSKSQSNNKLIKKYLFLSIFYFIANSLTDLSILYDR